MNLKKEIYKACEPPQSAKRDSFLKSLPYPKLTYPEFVLSQIVYIRKRMWIISAFILLAGIFTACVIPYREMVLLWLLSSLTPFLALLTSAEISRSDIFGMSELEAGCRFALPQLAGARMLILGVCNFIVISSAAIILGIFSPFGIAKSALYILTPFISVCGISLAVFDKAKGQDGVYISGAAALAVSLLGIILFSEDHYVGIHGNIANLINLAVCAAGTFLTIMQIKKILTGKDNHYGIKD